MSGFVHIFSASLQPATSWVDRNGETEIRGGFSPDEMLFCHSCGECWPASQMSVQCYYDGMYIACSEGFGCRDIARIEAHRARSKSRRSYAMREAWRRRKERAEASP